MIRRALLLVALLAATAGAAAPSALAAEARTSLPDIEDEVMCVTCNVALNVAEAPQADRQREFIRGLVAQGRTKDEIKDELVAAYGPEVLALPDSGGFGLTAYLVPVALVGLLVAGLALLLPRWRRRTAAAAAAPATPAGPALSAADANRLDEDLRRYEA